ncbi:coiled-coil domain-containing protein 69-like [Sinocyclocheilus grahami]|uniref:coiled-coil domain-containing protein 69-like n=1 Tax=Sinocyclocheilus grahami TaxID=75366 RepID=UPI0007ACDAA1|nr:PREDICTED: coiled-coil domain-containing protein 69-like [Sinocyclocheilus grahami]
MGCHNSKVCGQVSRKKKKNKAQGTEKHIKDIKLQGGSGTCSSEENLLETYECQLKILHAVLTASGGQERDQLLKDHPGDICTLVHSIIEKGLGTCALVHLSLCKPLTNKAKPVCREGCYSLPCKEELQQLHSEEKNVLNESHAAAENALKDQIEGLTSELKLFNELKRRAEESTLKRDLQRNIETHGSPGAFWEQEQESLLFVIEMKRERLQDHGNKLLQMETLFPLFHKLLSSSFRQLSKEQNELQEALEKQSLQNRKLSQEKEELLFKLIHRRDSCSSFHLPSVIPTQVSPS